MATILFGDPIYSDASALYTPTLSGGSWVAGLPLTNLQDRRLSRVARSTDDALTSTRILVDLGVARAVRAIGLFGHNLSTAAGWRIRGSSAVLTNVAADPQAPSNWSSAGTPIITTGIPDPLGGTAAILVEDNDGAADEGKFTACGFTGDATKVVIVVLAPGTATALNLRLVDSSVGVRHGVRLTWQGGTTAPTLATVAGAGTLYDPVAIYDSAGRLWWVVPFSATGVVAANPNVLEVLTGPAASDTGTFYLAGGEAFNLTGAELLSDAGGPVWPSGQTLETLTDPPAIVTTLDAVTARYWQIELGDPANAAGYVDVGRLAICGGWQPTFNLDYGDRLGLETDTTRQRTDGGAVLYTERPVRRTLVGALTGLPEDDGFTAFDMQRRLGISGQLVVVMDPADTTHLHRRSFLATWNELSAFEQRHLARLGVPISLVEEL